MFRISLGISSSAIGLKFYSITGGIKMCKPIIKKKKEKHTEIVLFTKSKLNNIKGLIFKALIDSNISLNVQCVIVKNQNLAKTRS